ncbi:aldehyde dehydrogenase family protein [Echinicola vietnamensis]|uniref:Aldehyde dehydrogenase n=1 Tax=Echinicola vietnamensis (strain DSM 17526 / LMG 23754 / KMM 6221) TaxID=926556 RepID=L0FXI6_ECHVK|nr:aldehyde dehydrogenase family protein [Echinicola vietnamensis]AGA77763.1 NAD-dependent aldehyde dehydrogenase [Echinicola vietnamensis DSM 17526]
MIQETVQAQKQKALKNQQSTLSSRIKKLEQLKEWIKSNQKEIEKALYADLRKPAAEVAVTETSFVVMEINAALKQLPKWTAPTKVGQPIHMLGTQAYLQAEPKGAVLIISPWNYPFNLSVAPLVSAIAAGCSACLKPSEHSPHTSALLRRMVTELFAVEDVTIFEGGVPVTSELLEQPFDHIFFTGSTEVGKIVMKAAAKNLTSVTLELGGKSPAIIDQGFDLEDAAKKIAIGKFINSGQTCIAPDYLFVHESQKQDFIETLKAQVNRMYNANGKGFDRNPDYGRIIHAPHIVRLQNMLKDAQTKGAHVEFGGKNSLDQQFMEPTVVSNVSEAMDLMKEEIFGPILPIITYHQLDDVIQLIQLKPKPLAVYAFTTDDRIIEQLSKNTSSGALVINDCAIQFLHSELPFGGIGASGMGRSHGHAGFLAFSNEKAILKQRTGKTLPKLLYPPYGLKTSGIIKAFMKWVMKG